ncbi:MAG: GNAT family N-acetyltransferase [Beijerinckiaceae bacterium]
MATPDSTRTIGEAVWPADRETVVGLFRAYAASLDVDLCFQDFDAELATLPGKYARPDGAVFLARADGAAAAVGCYRRFGDGCEMKRLFVRPGYRGLGLGRVLAQRLIGEARAAGHSFMVLDSLAGMRTAQALYGSLGFVTVPAYYDNPLPDTVYMRLDF